MKIKVDDINVFELTEIQKKVIKNEIPDDIFEADMKRRLTWVLMHKYHQCFARFRKEWEPKLAASGIKSLPVDQDEFAELVFSKSEYKSRQQKIQIDIDEINKKRLKADPNAKPIPLKVVEIPLDPSMKSAD